MSINPEAVTLAKRFEPILLLHADERYFPIDPKFYLERCALWRSAPGSDKKADWGEAPRTVFPRRPQIAKGKIAGLKDEASGGTVWIGEPSNLVIREAEQDRPPSEDRFMELDGWEPSVPSPNEVTATSNNRHPSLSDPERYATALQGAKPWYYVEYFNNQQLLREFGQRTPNGLDLFRVITNARLSAPKLLVFHFFYALHEEPLRGCEEAGEGQTFATFAGEWTSVAVLLNSANEPLYIGLTSRNVGDPTSVPTEEHRLGMIVRPWKDVERIGEHPKIYVSRGTHGNYLTTGLHDAQPFTPGDIDISQGTCAQIEALDDVIAGGEAETIEGESGSPGIIVLKILGSMVVLPATPWLIGEDMWGTFATEIPAIEPNRKPRDETGGPLFGLILKPDGVFVPEQASAQRTVAWPTAMPAEGVRPRYDFVVDRETQAWWPPLGANPGYVGRWGPRVTNDPKRRRSGMRCPTFSLMFLQALATI
ncbi:MAG: hypothetical protein IT306_05030 [Chloroflexi bacterium]|nr:hypothetical protein [Chloroflexota bacterium]